MFENIWEYTFSLSALFTTFAINNTFTTLYTKEASFKIWKKHLF